MSSGTREEVKATTKQLIRSFGTTGLMLGADCTIPATIDYERLRWVVEAAEDSLTGRICVTTILFTAEKSEKLYS